MRHGTWQNRAGPTDVQYISIGVYTAQAQARAVENRVHLIKSKFGRAMPSRRFAARHGGSRALSGSWVLWETQLASVTSTLAPRHIVKHEEGLLCSTLELDDATALYANKSLLPEYALAQGGGEHGGETPRTVRAFCPLQTSWSRGCAAERRNL